MPIRWSIAVALTLLLSGCGLGGAAMSAAAGGASEAQQLKQAKQTEAHIEQQLQSAERAQQRRLEKADAAAQ